MGNKTPCAMRRARTLTSVSGCSCPEFSSCINVAVFSSTAFEGVCMASTRAPMARSMILCATKMSCGLLPSKIYVHSARGLSAPSSSSSSSKRRKPVPAHSLFSFLQEASQLPARSTASTKSWRIGPQSRSCISTLNWLHHLVLQYVFILTPFGVPCKPQVLSLNCFLAAEDFSSVDQDSHIPSTFSTFAYQPARCAMCGAQARSAANG
mmetsp:Transcript_37702/g.118004  ORF Transcript_37702/g.118004 Transcript_37702/m.118004 type:complete len:209 (-) Transcript_37702:7-633(-)